MDAQFAKKMVVLWHISGCRNDHILRKNVLLKLNFQHDGHLYANCLIYI